MCALLQHGKAAHVVLYEMHVNCFGYKCWDRDVGCQRADELLAQSDLLRVM